jgi:putative protease
VTGLRGAEVTVASRLTLHPGDGLCFFETGGELRGTSVNAVRGSALTLQHTRGIRVGVTLYRNHDHAFLTEVGNARPARRLAVRLTLRGGPDGVSLLARDEDGVEIEHRHADRLETARDPQAALTTIRRQLARTGQSIYDCTEVAVELSPVPFLAVSLLNGLRREALDLLTAERERRRPRIPGGTVRNDVPFPEGALSYLGNVLNAKAAAFYRRHGVTKLEPAAESGLDFTDRVVMTTRYCLLHQLDLCHQLAADEALLQPLYLVDDEGHRLRLEIDCSRCRMEISLE